MNDVPFLVAFAGGLVATVNPCGFAMAPAYLSFLVGRDDTRGGGGPTASVFRALPVGLSVSAGFAAVFALAGIVLVALGQAATRAIPWGGLAVGFAVIVLGVWVLTGHGIPVTTHFSGGAPRHQGVGPSFLFGVGYATASLSCTLPVFLAVVVASVARVGLGSAVAVFAVYTLGMILPLLTVTVALVIGRDALVRRVRGVGRHAGRISGALLILSGSYVVYYWATELSGLTNPVRNVLVGLVEGTSSFLTSLIGENPVWWGVALATALGAAVGMAKLFRRRGRQANLPPEPISPPIELVARRTPRDG